MEPLSITLLRIIEKSENKPVTVGSLFKLLEGRGYPILLIILSLPFSLPISIPGLSVVFGLILAILGLRICFGKTPWLPEKLKHRSIPSHSLVSIAHKALWLSKKLEKILRPRLLILSQNRYLLRIHGLIICVLGIFLALPLPIPLSNLPAAWPILFLALGLLENDGLFILLGYLGFLFAVVFFAGLIFFGEKGIHHFFAFWNSLSA